MLRCVRCETENPEDSQFCDECGRRLTNFVAANPENQHNVRLTMSAEDHETNSEFSKTATISPDSLIGWQIDDSSSSGSSNNNKSTIENLQTAATLAETPTFAYARLIIERGKNAGKEFVLSENEINIGRWDADNGVFPDVDLDAEDPEAKVSRRHARIVRYGNQHLVEDLGSTNGTFINRGRRLLPGNRQVIEDGDEIIVGKTFLRFQVIR